jgi:hypothetical protein
MKSFLTRHVPPRATAVAVVALVLAASVVTGREKPSGIGVEPAERLAAQIRAEPTVDALDLAKLERPEAESPATDPFAPRSFAPPAPPAPKPRRGAPVWPAAPELPFRYVGKLVDDGALSVFLARGEASYSVKGGESIDGEYRVDKVSETDIVFTYLPLNVKQRLHLPSVN